MARKPYFHRDYIPFSHAATEAERLFLNGEWKDSLEEIEKMRQIVQNKIQEVDP